MDATPSENICLIFFWANYVSAMARFVVLGSPKVVFITDFKFNPGMDK